jgi:hypothetical protein
MGEHDTVVVHQIEVDRQTIETIRWNIERLIDHWFASWRQSR